MERSKEASSSFSSGMPSLPFHFTGHASHVAEESRTVEIYSAALGARIAKSSSKEIDISKGEELGPIMQSPVRPTCTFVIL